MSSAKKRHEIDGHRIRALYGHSVPGRVVKAEAAPSEQLFHGTSPQAWTAIQRTGLWPMGRQYVHLSVDAMTAEQVGRRKSSSPVVLLVQAQRAHAGVSRFWRGNNLVWLADHISPEYISAAGP